MSVSLNSFFNAEEFPAVWKKLVNSVSGVCWWKQPEDAEDTAMNVLVRLFLSFKEWKIEDKSDEEAGAIIWSYIFQCLRSELGEEKRKFRRLEAALKVPEWNFESRRIPPQVVRRAFEQLPEPGRALLKAHYIDERTLDDVYEALNRHLPKPITRRAFDARFQRLLRKLKLNVETALKMGAASQGSPPREDIWPVSGT